MSTLDFLITLGVYLLVGVVLWWFLCEERRWESSPAFIVGIFWLPYMLYRLPRMAIQFVQWIGKGLRMLRKGDPQGRDYYS